jgi:hypothetical protein
VSTRVPSRSKMKARIEVDYGSGRAYGPPLDVHESPIG